MPVGVGSSEGLGVKVCLTKLLDFIALRCRRFVEEDCQIVTKLVFGYVVRDNELRITALTFVPKEIGLPPSVPRLDTNEFSKDIESNHETPFRC